MRRAQIFSDVFSPLLMPTYGMALAMWLTPLRVLPEKSRLLATLMIALITGVTPLAAIAAMRSMGYVSDNSISRREQRFVPMIIVLACYIGAALFLDSAHAPFWLQLFFYGAAVATAIATVITFRWKISAHCTAAGGLAGMMMWLADNQAEGLAALLFLSVVLLIVGGVGTSRLILKRHTLAQVVAGFALGFGCTFGLLIIF